MNNEQYNDILLHAKTIRRFNEMVSNETTQPTAKKVLRYVAEITDQEATEFINEFYSRMDISIKQPRILFNDLSL